MRTAFFSKEQGGGNEVGVFAIIGIVLSVLMSWAKWHSIAWVIIHGVFGWTYVLYYLLVYGFPA